MRRSTTSRVMSIRSSLIWYIKKIVEWEKADNKYEEIFWEKKCELIYYSYERLETEFETLKHLGLIEFINEYETYKKLEPEEIFKAWQDSILGELKEIAFNEQAKIQANKDIN